MSFLDKFRRPDHTISDMYGGDLAKILIGRRIVNISTDEKLLELDDGTVLHFENTSDCCAWFSAQLRDGNLTTNGITAVRTTDHTKVEGYFDSFANPVCNYTLHILAEDHNIVDLDIEGDPTSGYYCQSINLEIWNAQKAK